MSACMGNTSRMEAVKFNPVFSLTFLLSLSFSKGVVALVIERPTIVLNPDALV